MNSPNRNGNLFTRNSIEIHHFASKFIHTPPIDVYIFIAKSTTGGLISHSYMRTCEILKHSNITILKRRKQQHQKQRKKTTKKNAETHNSTSERKKSSVISCSKDSVFVYVWDFVFIVNIIITALKSYQKFLLSSKKKKLIHSASRVFCFLFYFSALIFRVRYYMVSWTVLN